MIHAKSSGCIAFVVRDNAAEFFLPLDGSMLAHFTSRIMPGQDQALDTRPDAFPHPYPYTQEGGNHSKPPHGRCESGTLPFSEKAAYVLHENLMAAG